MNARQKAKKLKKELEKIKADKTNGFKWLKIDGFSRKEEPRLYYDNIPLIHYIPVTYEIQIGHTTVEITLEDPEDILVVIDSAKLDAALKSRRGDSR